MAVQSKAWEQVGENFESLGTHLRSHFDEVSAEASAERAAAEKSVRGLISALEDGFEAARKAVRDPVVREDLNSVATSVRAALLDAFETAEGQVRERLARPAAAHRPTAKQSARTAKRPAGVAKAAPRKPSAKKTAGKHAAG